jgi:hypothetical protein
MDNYVFTLDTAALIKIANQTKEIVVRDLCIQGYLSQDVAEEYLRTRVVTAYRPSWLGAMWNRIRKRQSKNDDLVLTILETLIPDEEEEKHVP